MSHRVRISLNAADEPELALRVVLVNSETGEEKEGAVKVQDKGYVEYHLEDSQAIVISKLS